MNKLYAAVLLLAICSGTRAQLWRPGFYIKEYEEPHTRSIVADDLPDAVDNSLSPYFPPIVSQHGGSCAQAAGIHYLFTYEVNRMLDRPVADNKENIFSYRYVWNMLNDGSDEGGFTTDGLDLARRAGVPTQKAFGNQDNWYYQWPSGYQTYYDALRYRVKETNFINLKTEQGIERLCRYFNNKRDGHKGGGIACFAISSKPWSESDYNGPSATGYNSIILLSGEPGAHAMTLAGYDLTVEYDCNGNGVIDDDERGAFILVNSWGTWWGSNGRSYIPFKYFTDSFDYFTPDSPGLSEDNARAICIETYQYEPSIVFGVNLNYSSRNDLSFELGVADGAQATRPEHNYMVYVPIMSNQGGDYSMQGSYSEGAKNMEVAFDYSQYAHKVAEMKAPCFFLTVTKRAVGKTGTGYLKGFTVNCYEGGKKITSYKQEFTSQTGLIKAKHYFKLPTKSWYKNGAGEWMEPKVTSASALIETDTRIDDFLRQGVFIRTARGESVEVRGAEFNPSTGEIGLDLSFYEE